MTDCSEKRADLLHLRRELVKGVPTQSEIFLPTSKIALADQVNGLKRVASLYLEYDCVHRPKLEALRAQYKSSKRAFIIGNGPSLNETDLSKLAGEVTFAVNGFFLKEPELDWRPTFYLVEDHLVAEDRMEAINGFRGPIKVFPVYLAYCLEADDRTLWLRHLPRVSYPTGFDFSTDAANQTYTGCTVTYTAIQLAHWLGFKELYLIGVDASYAKPADAKVTAQYGTGVIDMASDDINHFHPDYFGKGFRWHDPQVDKMVEAYKEARSVTDRTGRKIFNATIGGELEVFERVNYEELFPLQPEAFPKLQIEAASGTPSLALDLFSGYPEGRVVFGGAAVRVVELHPGDQEWFAGLRSEIPIIAVPTKACLDEIVKQGDAGGWPAALRSCSSLLVSYGESIVSCMASLELPIKTLPLRSPVFGPHDPSVDQARVSCHSGGDSPPADALSLVLEASAELRQSGEIILELPVGSGGPGRQEAAGVRFVSKSSMSAVMPGAITLLLSPLQKDTGQQSEVYPAGHSVGEITGAVVCIGYPKSEALKKSSESDGAFAYKVCSAVELGRLLAHLVRDPDVRAVSAERFKRDVTRQSDGLMRQILWAHVREVSKTCLESAQ